MIFSSKAPAASDDTNKNEEFQKYEHQKEFHNIPHTIKVDNSYHSFIEYGRLGTIPNGTYTKEEYIRMKFNVEMKEEKEYEELLLLHTKTKREYENEIKKNEEAYKKDLHELKLRYNMKYIIYYNEKFLKATCSYDEMEKCTLKDYPGSYGEMITHNDLSLENAVGEKIYEQHRIPDEKTIIVGDIHGNLNELKSLIKKLQKYLDDHNLVFLGDYIDR